MIRLRVFQVQGTPSAFRPLAQRTAFVLAVCITATKIVRFVAIAPRQGELLEQPEDFEDDHDNDNHSNYVKDVSVHAGDSYQIAYAMVKIYPKLISHPSKIA